MRTPTKSKHAGGGYFPPPAPLPSQCWPSLCRPSANAASPGPNTVGGLTPGAIKHVWLIILENKSYDETFTGLNNNSYLWQTLPSEGVLLKNYYGTGHTSQDNYIALAFGPGPQADTPERLQHRRHAVQ